jgi:hypothetical protein
VPCIRAAWLKGRVKTRQPISKKLLYQRGAPWRASIHQPRGTLLSTIHQCFPSGHGLPHEIAVHSSGKYCGPPPSVDSLQ